MPLTRHGLAFALSAAALLMVALGGLNRAGAQTTAPATQPALASPAPPQPVYHFRPAAGAHDCQIGSLDRARGYDMQVNLTSTGAGITWITLTDYKLRALSTQPYAVYRNREPFDSAQPNVPDAMAALEVIINGQKVALEQARGPDGQVQLKEWTLEPGADASHAVYQALIEDGAGRPVLEVRRTYHLDPSSYDLQCRQEIINRSSQALTVSWLQNLVADVPPDETGYRSDGRAFDAGYYNLVYDPNRNFMYTDHTTVARTAALDAFEKSGRPYWPVNGLPAKYELEWVAETNRYFALVAHRPVPAIPAGQVKHAIVPPLVTDNAQLGMTVVGVKDAAGDTREAALTWSSPQITLAPGAKTVLDLGLYAGPRDLSLWTQEPYRSLCLVNLPKYSVGCSWCILDWLADALLWLLKALRALVFDWGVAIVILVLVVRLIMHPITRRSQIAMMRTGKQMAALKPELEALKARYKDDTASYQREQMALYREKGISPFSMVGGCLPMLLQTPIWASLYAMLYSAIELRNQPAFYGVFQVISHNHWAFLADLSSPDNFLLLPPAWRFHVPLLGIPIDGLNILPILMAAVFYVQQKISTPPAADDQARQQQKIATFSSLLFPIMMYSVPSGLTLYIMASTAAGIVDSAIVRRHIQREEAAGRLFQPKKHKRGGLWDRLQKMMEDRQQALQGGERRRRYKERD